MTWTVFNSEALVFGIFVVFAGLYAVFIPSFEGPDESEHCRYIEAYAENAKIHPVDPKVPYRWGYQVHHPPLYYWLMGQYAKLVRPEFHAVLTANPWQNPRFPFIRHDLPGHRFPFDGVNRSLRLLRLPSVLAGILTFIIVCFAFRRLFPDDPTSRCFLLTTAMLAPNSLQLCGIVANDGLNLLFSATALYLALKTIQEEKPASSTFFFAGLFVGFGMITKQTTLITLATVGTLWAVDAMGNRRLRVYLKGVLWFLLPLLILVIPYFYLSYAMYQDVTMEPLLRLLTPALYLDTPRPTFFFLNVLVQGLPQQFLADLCWKTIHVEGLSWYLFWLWLAGAVFSVAVIRPRRSEHRVLVPERLISITAIWWSLVFLIFANRHWMNLQVRHLWCVYPFTVVALVYVLSCMPIRYRRWRRLLCVVSLIFAIALNVHVLLKFREFYRPSSNQNDRDYETYLYNYVNDRKRGTMYLRFGEYKGLPITVSKGNEAQAYFNEGERYRMKGDFRNAIKCYEKAKNVDPDYLRAYVNMGNVYMESLYDFEKAGKTFMEALEIAPGNPRVLYNMGLLYLNLKQKAKARKYFLKTLEVDPNHADAHINLGYIYGMELDYEKALSEYFAALPSNRKSSELWGQIGNIYIKLNKYSGNLCTRR
jgi:tetratricopeptide (TPR) repeat protein